MSLDEAFDYLTLLAELQPERAAVRWLGRFEVESPALTLVESQLALAALTALYAGERDGVGILRRLLQRVRPSLIRSIP